MWGHFTPTLEDVRNPARQLPAAAARRTRFGRAARFRSEPPSRLSPTMLSPQQVEEFETRGYTLAETTLSAQELDDAEATWDRLMARSKGNRDTNSTPRGGEDEGYLRLITHPFFEGVAKQMLRSDDVRLIELGANNRAPTGEPQASAEDQAKRWHGGAHIDLQITTADFNATPRRDLLAMWFWISDVTPDHAAMRILPGSHLPVMQHWEETLGPERKLHLPRVHGLHPAPSINYPSYPEYLPPHATLDYASHIPTPVAVKRGTAQVFTQAMLHSAWHNSTTEPRKGFTISWSALGVPIGFEAGT